MNYNLTGLDLSVSSILNTPLILEQQQECIKGRNKPTSGRIARIPLEESARIRKTLRETKQSELAE